MKLPRLWPMLACLPLSLSAQPAVSAPPAKPAEAVHDMATLGPKLGSTVFDFATLKAKPTGNGERRDVTERPTATFEKFESHITTLLPGKISHPPHQHLQEELIILRDGTLEASINGVTTRVGAGSLLFFASNDFHNVKNVGDTPATYFVFNFTTGLTKSAPKQGATAAAVPGKLVSSVFDWAKLEVKPNKTGERRDVVNSPTNTMASFECHVTTLKPGEAPHAAHHHPDEEIVLVKEGTLEINLPAGRTTAGPGSIILAGSNDEHGWRNAGATTATYYVLRIITDATPKS